MEFASLDSPLGRLTVAAENGVIRRLTWDGFMGRPTSLPTAAHTCPALTAAIHQLRGYFDGDRAPFNLPLAPLASPLVQRVCAAMTTIPYGETLTYGAIAAQVGSGARAVGRACGANPIPILIPCHRVVGAGGKLTGYSGAGGTVTKKWLLDLEAGQSTWV
ncbi:MAG: methylated-DNA--[protein]-cysteine S-methyltransferase [Pseudomonadota bacterium]|nr:methylated-DNA--[protein]-cysteine S-methyltransferase [Pseudomonadota bacterium]